MSAKRRLVLGIVRTDTTFTQASLRGRSVWIGKCLHCNAKLVVDEDGATGPGVTVEHILPRQHGGTDEARNLALACARCNNLKGKRLDARAASDPRLKEVVEALRAKREARWREG